MPIFYLLNNRWPTIRAYGIQVAKTCQGFIKAGTNLTLIVPDRAEYKETKNKDPFAWYGVIDKFNLIRLPSFDALKLGFSSKKAFVLQQTLFALLATLALVFRRGIIYSRDQFSLYFLSFFKKNIFWEIHRLPKNLNSITYRRLIDKVQGIIVISKGIKNALLASGVIESKILVSPDGVDIEEINQCQAVHRSTKHLVVYAGQLFDWKGIETLVNSAQLLDDRFEIVIVGGTEEDITRFKSEDQTRRIRWIGSLPHQEALEWIVSANAVVLPNRRDGDISEFYTSPLKMFEYMAAGKCIVASDLPSIREVLNENNALLVEPGNPRALAEGLFKSIQPEIASQLGQQAFSDSKTYTWENRASSILNFIKSKND